MNRFESIGEVSTSMCLNQGRGTDRSVMTVPITGVPRGGTTMVAAVVEALGINLGPREDLVEYHFEDQTMNSPYVEIQHKYLRQRNAHHKVWGWKDPAGVHSIKNIIYALRNPHTIVVFRDTLASIQGEMRFDKQYEVDPQRPFHELAEATLTRWRDIWEFVTSIQVPIMLVSYERAVMRPKVFLNELSAFLGIDDVEKTDKALSRIGKVGGYLVTDPEWRRENR